jgi:hypothetical protein
MTGKPAQTEREKLNAYTADDLQTDIVTIAAHEFRLPEVLAHIEAGRIVRVILPPQRPTSE